jgi:hypothetical protein
VFVEKLAVAIRVLGCVVLAMVTGSLAGTSLADGVAASRTVHRCDARNVVVRSPDYADVPMACDGARDAIVFLASQGLEATSDVTIELVPKLSKQVSAYAAGCYLESEHRVLMLKYSAFEKCGSWFNISANRQLYRSFVAHEVAHAVAACNFKIAKPSIQAKEYIAFVTMFATMDPELRECVLSQSPGDGYEGDWQMSTTIYLLDPMRFGVQAYRHFRKPENGRDYLHAILAGRALID